MIHIKTALCNINRFAIWGRGPKLERTGYDTSGRVGFGEVNPSGMLRGSHVFVTVTIYILSIIFRIYKSGTCLRIII